MKQVGVGPYTQACACAHHYRLGTSSNRSRTACRCSLHALCGVPHLSESGYNLQLASLMVRRRRHRSLTGLSSRPPLVLPMVATAAAPQPRLSREPDAAGAAVAAAAVARGQPPQATCRAPGSQ
eukprot:364472-Chlamydomonas_euryale.AAC.8